MDSAIITLIIFIVFIINTIFNVGFIIINIAFVIPNIILLLLAVFLLIDRLKDGIFSDLVFTNFKGTCSSFG